MFKTMRTKNKSVRAVCGNCTTNAQTYRQPPASQRLTSLLGTTKSNAVKVTRPHLSSARHGGLKGGEARATQMSKNGSPKSPQSREESAHPQIEDRYATGYDFLLINHDIDSNLFGNVFECVTTKRQNDKVVVLVVTFGGLANVAYRVGRFLQTMYEEVVVFIPSLCKSGGTLLVAAAHRVIIIGFGELGPLDVQLFRRDEIWGQRSGLTTRSALLDLKEHTFELFDHFIVSIIARSRGSVSFRLAAEIAAKATGQMMSTIYAQINPEALGQDFMDLRVAEKYCERLNKKSGNIMPEAIRRLVYDYPSHDFVIDFEEAKEIFHNVELPTPTILSLLNRPVSIIQPRTGIQGIVMMLDSISKPLETKENVVSQGEGDENASHDKGTRGNPGGAEASA